MLICIFNFVIIILFLKVILIIQLNSQALLNKTFEQVHFLTFYINSLITKRGSSMVEV